MRVVRVVRGAVVAPAPVAATAIIIELREARVVVPPGTDRATLATVLAALGAAS